MLMDGLEKDFCRFKKSLRLSLIDIRHRTFVFFFPHEMISHELSIIIKEFYPKVTIGFSLETLAQFCMVIKKDRHLLE